MWIIVFEARPPRSLFQFLHQGFRHCLGFRNVEGPWQKYDLMNVNEPIGEPIDARAIDLMAGLASIGATSIMLNCSDQPVALPMRARLFSCVEILKRQLGLNINNIQTPLQLFKYLQQNSWSITDGNWTSL